MCLRAPSVKQFLQFPLLGFSDGAALETLVSFIDIVVVLEGRENFSLEKMGLLLCVDLPLHKLQSKMLMALKLINVLDLCLDRCIHFSNFVIFSACVLVIVTLELSHVAPTHLCILHHELLVKLSIKLVIL